MDGRCRPLRRVPRQGRERSGGVEDLSGRSPSALPTTCGERSPTTPSATRTRSASTSSRVRSSFNGSARPSRRCSTATTGAPERTPPTPAPGSPPCRTPPSGCWTTTTPTNKAAGWSSGSSTTRSRSPSPRHWPDHIRWSVSSPPTSDSCSPSGHTCSSSPPRRPSVTVVPPRTSIRSCPRCSRRRCRRLG